ncbi:MAG: protein kinase [Deltaproteobacteria bacterium]|nr:protein kinase [Deltaproteobacteria bacterium]
MPILTDEERLGSQIGGKYRLDWIVGRGGMGVVFAATHGWTGRRVAVKLLHPEYSREEKVVTRFLQEARTAASIKHANVVDVLDMSAEADGTVYLVLEFLEGESLAHVLDRGPLSPARALEILLPIMDALDAAHRRGIVHRDLKPDNIFLNNDPTNGAIVPKLLDFGIAKVIESVQGRATQTGTIVGTPHYMSPEQALGSPDVGPSSDVWSMGVVLYQCLSGELPFNGGNATGVLLAITTGQHARLGSIAPHIPPNLEEAVERALIVNRQQRYTSMRQLIDALKAASVGLPADGPMLAPRQTVPLLETPAPGTVTGSSGVAQPPMVGYAHTPPPLTPSPHTPPPRVPSSPQHTPAPTAVLGTPTPGMLTGAGAPAVGASTPAPSLPSVAPPPQSPSAVGTPVAWQSQASTPSQMPKKGNGLLFGGAAVLVLLLGLGAGGVWYSARSDRNDTPRAVVAPPTPADTPQPPTPPTPPSTPPVATDTPPATPTPPTTPTTPTDTPPTTPAAVATDTPPTSPAANPPESQTADAGRSTTVAVRDRDRVPSRPSTVRPPPVRPPTPPSAPNRPTKRLSGPVREW